MELSKVTMILRGYTYEQVRCVAEVLINSSYVKNMEITLNTSNAYEIIKKIADEFQGRLHIGAGTVQTYDELVQAIAAGADVYVTGDIGHHEDARLLQAAQCDCSSRGFYTIRNRRIFGNGS